MVRLPRCWPELSCFDSATVSPTHSMKHRHVLHRRRRPRESPQSDADLVDNAPDPQPTRVIGGQRLARRHGPATGPSRARSSHSTRRSTTAGSSSAARSYDFTEWKDHRPGGPFVARMYGGQGRHGGVRRVPQPARRAAHAVLLRRGRSSEPPAERAGDASEVEPSLTWPGDALTSRRFAP